MKFLIVSAVISLLVVSVFGQRGAEKCHGAAAQLDDCLEKVESTQEFRDLKKKEKSILKQCLQQNSGTTCQIGSAGGEKCRREARKDSSLKSAKEAMYSAIDNCFDGKIGNPFSVLRMTGDMGATARKKGRHGGGGGGGGPSPTGSPIVDPGDFMPSDGSSSSSGSSGGSSGSQNCPTPVDQSSSLGGSSTDILGGSGAADPTSLFSSFGSGGLPGGASGLAGASPLSSLGGGLGGLGDPSSLFSGFGRRRRRETAEAVTACKPIFECVHGEKQKLQGDKNLSRSANRVFKAIQRCKAENSPSLSCTPSSKTQKECVRDARKGYSAKLKEFMSSCLGKQTDVANGE